jgi:AAA domain-containing protein
MTDLQCADCPLTGPGVTFEDWAKPPRALCGACREEAREIVFGRLESDAAERPRSPVAREPVSGGAFALDVPDDVPAVWGEGDQVLMAAGEPLLVCAPPGVGKTTLIGQFALARAGVLEPTLLGLPIEPDDRPVLYIAADRPAQIARSMRRMVDEQHRAQLDARLKVWRGPLPFNVVDDPARLAEWLAILGVGTVVVDSLKDIAVGLSEDAIGAAVNQSLQHVVACEIEVVALHHQRKGQDGRKPRRLEDVYGSTWLTAGAGSVVLLWGEAGDPYVELVHLKQPASEVGPLTIHHDHDRGRRRCPRPSTCSIWPLRVSARTMRRRRSTASRHRVGTSASAPVDGSSGSPMTAA